MLEVDRAVAGGPGRGASEVQGPRSRLSPPFSARRAARCVGQNRGHSTRRAAGARAFGCRRRCPRALRRRRLGAHPPPLELLAFFVGTWQCRARSYRGIVGQGRCGARPRVGGSANLPHVCPVCRHPGRSWPFVNRCWPDFGKLGPTFCRHWPISAEHRPNSANFGRTQRLKLSTIRPTCANIGQNKN